MFYPKRIPKLIDKIFPQCLWRKADGAIYLTFDDSPSPFTLELLEMLDKVKVRATFFLVGKNIEAYPDFARMIVEHGHRVGNHSFSHSHKLLEIHFREEISKTNRLLLELDASLATAQPLFRFPYGRFTLRALNVLKESGITPVMWSLLTADFDSRVTEKQSLRLLRSSRMGDIVVMHDNAKAIEKLRSILPIALYELSEQIELRTL